MARNTLERKESERRRRKKKKRATVVEIELRYNQSCAEVWKEQTMGATALIGELKGKG